MYMYTIGAVCPWGYTWRAQRRESTANYCAV